MGMTPHDSRLLYARNREKEQNLLIEWGNSDLWGRFLRLLEVTSKNLLFFSELVAV